jgi:lipopolysaccharide/colanic/teichoic acid biosynthesis glycosyltransferase
MTYYVVVKRIIDICGAVVGIIIFLPLKIAVVLHIKRVSPEGPVFADMPLRAGKDGRRFKMYKFRSMYPGAHEKMLADPVLSKIYRENDYKLEAGMDPRLIPGAVFLRKSSIDELPQFFNVLRGHMSLVGPRAYFPEELQEQSKKYGGTEEHIEEHIEVLLTTKPGITGPWQVGGRNEIEFPARVKMDAEYAKRQSILYDLMIMVKTPIAVFSGRGVS